MFKLIVAIAVALIFSPATPVAAQPIKMTIGQTGINPGTGPFIIAQRENLFAKHGLEVKIIETQTTAAVQAMLGGSMQFTMGAGAAFTTATLEGAPPFVTSLRGSTSFPIIWSREKSSPRLPTSKARPARSAALSARRLMSPCVSACPSSASILKRM